MKYNPALDGIRAFAVIMVMCFHAGVPRIHGGFLGVDVFFVLSGYLITTLLLSEYERTGTIRLGTFYRRRFARLTPPLVVMLFVYLLVSRYLWPETTLGDSVRDVLAALFYLSDYSLTFWNVPSHLAHTWSLSVEEQFYVIWPLALLFLFNPDRNRYAVKLLIATYVSVTLWRIGWVILSAHPYEYAYYRFDTRVTGLILGALFAVFAKRKKNISLLIHPNLLAIAAAFLFAIYSWKIGNVPEIGMTFGTVLAEWASILLIAVSIWSDKQAIAYQFLANPLAVFLGKMSYGLYLWHFPIFLYLGELYPWYVTLPLGGAIALAFSMISYHTVEKVARTKIRAISTQPVAE